MQDFPLVKVRDRLGTSSPLIGRISHAVSLACLPVLRRKIRDMTVAARGAQRHISARLAKCYQALRQERHRHFLDSRS